jgi:hypothetical protein
MAPLSKPYFRAFAAIGALAPAAAAQATNPSDWNRPYGTVPGQETRPYQGRAARAIAW